MKIRKVLVPLAVIFVLIAGLVYQIPVSIAQTPPASVLLVVNSSGAGKYGPYVGEILRAEGLNSFDQVQIGAVNSVLLSAYSLVSF